MKTLRSEFFKDRNHICSDNPAGAYYAAVEFLNTYGDYRVVEGVLACGECSGDVWVSSGIRACRIRTDIGKRGAHVKLFLPPEKKKSASDVEVNLEMLYTLFEKTDKALQETVEERNKYEKALSKIYRNWRGISGVAQIAKEVLDEYSVDIPDEG